MALLKADTLKKVIEQHQELPILFFCSPDICYEAEYSYYAAASMNIRIAEVLDHPDFTERIYLEEDYDEFEEEVDSYLAEEYPNLSEEEYQKKLSEELEKYDKYWKKAIIVYLGV